MGLAETLGVLWRSWSDSLPSVLLVILLVLLSLGWIVAGGAVQVLARRHLANSYGWTVATLVPAVAIAAVGISKPRSFHYWLIAGLVVTPLVALANRALIAREAASCAEGHPLAASWIYCPQCEPPPKEAAGKRLLVGATPAPVATHNPRMPSGGMAGPPRPVSNPTMGGGYSRGDGAQAAVPAGDVLLWLVPESRPELGERVVRKPGATIGRNPSSDVALEDAGASWDHARIVERSGSPSIVDLGSSNGTYVNSERVETSLLISGDRLKVGDTVFRVVRP